ncbi:cyclic di-GMP phosphodiesterase [Kosakonia cowanii]|uniref:cyclic di-GMP phosphodiesterase n=1 Tax=Kosakonia cowanii TaxID=208223 RepID=UPI0025A9F33F|nr:cyclic di-GMP phosphodiesterase [Kosakonia cowanii]MDM9615193.1 cyclic di-GMP phosphodiesterase [Kosakonia cowanii]MDP4560608.1 cyclic di-GMP phosphodiesterase [Kosakonia cowanii]
MLTRNVTVNRRVVLISLLTGALVALLVGGIQFWLEQQKREARYDTLLSSIQASYASYFSTIRTAAESLHPLTLNSCEEAASELTSKAAFSQNVRAFLLVKDQHAYCSSATGDMDEPMKRLIPGIDINKTTDMVILPGTPMMPTQPVIALWFRSPLLDNRGVLATLNINLAPYMLYTTQMPDLNGLALGIGGRALTTFSGRPLLLSTLHQTPYLSVQVEGSPVRLYLYADKWRVEDLQFALLLGATVGMLAGLLSAAMLAIHLRPGREILTAIKRDQFYVVYQPVVSGAELKVTGFEVLMRWKHPTAGEIPPDAFIHFAEAQQLIVPLTLHLFKLIARDAPVLKTLLPEGVKMGINIAPGHLHAPSFKEDMQQFALSLPPHHFSVVLEITERDMLKHDEVNKIFQWLHDEGFEIAIDDFGTGHSALIYLERFTLDFLKIDRGFVNAIGTETVTSPVLDAVLTLAKRLNMRTVAEGVETPEQVRWLRDRGVHYLQGYFFSRPMTLQQFIDWRPPTFTARL